MLVKSLLFLIIVAFVVIAVFVLVVVRIFWKGMDFLQSFFNPRPTDSFNRHDRDFTGRRQRQYGYSAKRGTTGDTRSSSYDTRSSSSASGSSGSSRRSGQDVVIIDTRSPEKANRRIFSESEGEYVDYTEE